MKFQYNKMKTPVLVLIALLLGAAHAIGQNAMFGTGYFQNQYLFNPAMSGVKVHQANIAGSFAFQNSDVENKPSSLALTADYGFNRNIGGGLQAFSEKTGLINTTKIAATYSFHMNLGSDEKSLHLGLSGQGYQSRLDLGGVVGDLADPTLQFFDRKMHFEAAFGAGYTDNNWNIQASMPNLVTLFKDKSDELLNLLNTQIVFASASYKAVLYDEGDNSIDVEPKIAYRGYKGVQQNIFDAGANFNFNEYGLNVYGIYHTNKSVTAGLGFKILNAAEVMASYTSQTPELNRYSFGSNFEFGLKFFFGVERRY